MDLEKWPTEEETQQVKQEARLRKSGVLPPVCPHCKEDIKPGATICPHCRQPVFSLNSGANAMIMLVGGAVLFVVLFLAINAFVNWQAARDMKVIREQAEVETRQMMRELGS